MRALPPAPPALAIALLVAMSPAVPAAAQSPPPAPDDRVEGSRTPPPAPLPALPVTGALPAAGAAPTGFTEWAVNAVDRVMIDAIQGGATPGAALVVGHRGRIVLSRAWGRVDWDPGSDPVTENTVFDLASVTKVAATALAAMALVEDERLDLDAPLHEVLPGWPASGDRGRITVRHLLSHRSGLPPFVPLYRHGDSRSEAMEYLGGVGLRSTPGAEEVYSDLDMILLGWAVEAAAGEPLDAFLDRRVYRPLGLARTAFRPTERGIDRADIAPTEVIRREHLHGVVHDPNARGLGGVAGNAGLFASARDLAVLASALLWETPGRVVCRDVLVDFTRPEGAGGSRYALGWESPATRTWRSVFSPSAFGHTGYTGTSMWVDPELDLFVILLTNRVNPTANNRRHLALRRELHSTVRRAMTDPWGSGAGAAEDGLGELATGWFDRPAERAPSVVDDHGWRSVDGCRAEAGGAVVERIGGMWGALVP